jgi:hypothetical protein
MIPIYKDTHIKSLDSIAPNYKTPFPFPFPNVELLKSHEPLTLPPVAGNAFNPSKLKPVCPDKAVLFDPEKSTSMLSKKISHSD